MKISQEEIEDNNEAFQLSDPENSGVRSMKYKFNSSSSITERENDLTFKCLSENEFVVSNRSGDNLKKKIGETFCHVVVDKTEESALENPTEDSESKSYDFELEKEYLPIDDYLSRNSSFEASMIWENKNKDSDYQSFLRKNSLTENEKEQYEQKYLLTNSLKINNNGNWDKTQGALFYCDKNAVKILTDAEKLNLELFNQNLLPNNEKIEKAVKRNESDDFSSVLSDKNTKTAGLNDDCSLHDKSNNIFTKKNKKYVDNLVCKVDKKKTVPSNFTLDTYNCVIDDTTIENKVEERDEVDNDYVRIYDKIPALNSKESNNGRNYKTLLNEELITWCENEFKLYEKMNLYENKEKSLKNKKNKEIIRNKCNKNIKTGKNWPNCSKYPKFKIDGTQFKSTNLKEKTYSLGLHKDISSKKLFTSSTLKKKSSKIYCDNNAELSDETKYFSPRSQSISYSSFNATKDCSNCSNVKLLSLNRIIDDDSTVRSINNSSQNISQDYYLFTDEIGTEVKDESILDNRTIDFVEKNQTFNKFTVGKVKSITKKTKLKKKKIKSFQEQSPKSIQIGQGKKAPNSTFIDRSTESLHNLQGKVNLKRINKFSSTDDTIKCQTRVLKRGKKKKNICNKKIIYDYPSSISITKNTLDSNSSKQVTSSFNERSLMGTPFEALEGPGIPIKKDDKDIIKGKNSIPFGILNSSPTFQQFVNESYPEYEIGSSIDIRLENSQKNMIEQSEKFCKPWRDAKNWSKLKLGFIGNQAINKMLISLLNQGM